MAIDSVDAADSVATHRYGDEAGQAVCSSLLRELSSHATQLVVEQHEKYTCTRRLT